MRRIWVHCAFMQPGDVLDERFELIGHSLHGPLGDVVTAHDRVTRETVALRFGAPGSGRREALAERLEHLAQLRISGMIQVIAHGLARDDARYLALARVDGATAQSLLSGAGITIAQAVSAARCVLRVLGELHARGIAHGGVTIERVVVGDRGPVLLEPAAEAGSLADDLVAAGRVLAHMLTGRACTTPACPPLPGRAPAELRPIVDALLAGGVAPRSAEERLAALAELDDVWRARAVDPSDAEVTHDAVIERSSAREPAGSETPPHGVPVTGEVPLTIKSTDRYELQGVIGQGGLGRVVLARDRELARPVAIKELLRQTPHGVARFRREAMVTARLQHPGIVPVHDAGRWPNGAPYYAMKLVEGDDLAVRVRACSDLGARLALMPHVVAACDAMAYAHDQGVIHRDLKPSNIVIGEFGETMIVDWGLAKDLAEPHVDIDGDDPYRGEPDGLTRAGEVLGTPAYMAPEQAHGGAVDRRTDVYALGALLFHVLAGRPPEASDDAATRAGSQQARRRVHETVALDELDHVPPDLVAIVRKAMAPDPDARYPSARELAAELRRFQAGQLVSARSYSLGELVRRWAARHRRALAVASVIVLAGLVLGAIAIVRIVAAEREARHARTTAEAQRAAADDARVAMEGERDRLAVLQAEQAVASDPAAALAWLRSDRALPPDLHARATAVVTRAEATGPSFARHELGGRILELQVARGRVVAVASSGELAVLDAAGHLVSSSKLAAPATALAVTDTSDDYVVASADRVLRWYGAGGTRELRVAAPVTQLVVVGHERVVYADGPQLWTWDGEHAPTPRGLDPALDGDIVALRRYGDGVIAGTTRGTLVAVGPEGVRWRRAAHRGAVVDLAVLGEQLVSAGDDRDLALWSARTGDEQRRTRVAAPVVRVALAPSGALVLLEDAVGTWAEGWTTRPLRYGGAALCGACAWPVASDGPELHLARAGDHRVLRGHADRVEVVAAVDARTFVSGDRRGGIRFWRAPAPAIVASVDAASPPVRTPRGWVIGETSGAVVEIDPSGRRTVVGTMAGPVTIVAARGEVVVAATRERVAGWRGAARVFDVPLGGALSLAVDDGEHFASVFGEHSAVVSLATGAIALERANLAELVLVVAEHALFVEDHALVRADLATGTRAAVALPFEPVLATVLPDHRVCVAALSGALAILDGAGQIERTLELGHDILSLASDGEWIVAGGADGRVHAWRPRDAARRTFDAGHERWVNGADVLGDHAVTWSRSAELARIWRLADGASSALVTSAPLRGVAFDTAGERVLSTDEEGRARIAEVSPPTVIAPGRLAAHVDADLGR